MNKRLLFTGLRAPAVLPKGSLHVPFIQVAPIMEPVESLRIRCICRAYEEYTHLLFTSQSAVHFFLKQFETPPSQLPSLYAVGKATSYFLQELGYPFVHHAHEETAEGVIALLQTTMPHAAHLFWPHSAQARPVLGQYLLTAPFRSTTLITYQTIQLTPEFLPDLTTIDGVVLTSPSTVHAFLACYGRVPDGLTCFAIGPITAATLRDYGYLSTPWIRG